MVQETGAREHRRRGPARVQRCKGVHREVHVAGSPGRQLPLAAFDAEHVATVVPRRDPVGELQMHLGAYPGRIAARGDGAGSVDDACHPVVGGDELDDLLVQEQRQDVERHGEDRDRVDLRDV